MKKEFDESALASAEKPDAGQKQPHDTNAAPPSLEEDKSASQALKMICLLMGHIATQYYGVAQETLACQPGEGKGFVNVLFSACSSDEMPDADLSSQHDDLDLYNKMRQFLSDLKGLDLEPDVHIDPDFLYIEASCKLALFDALKLYLSQEEYHLSTIDDIGFDFSMIKEKTPARIKGLIERAAADAQEAMEEDENTAANVLISSAPRPYLSPLHYLASLTHHFHADIPLSMDHILQTIRHEDKVKALWNTAEAHIFGGYN